jgi:uncharacterized RDD family membrane protein YckC
MNYAKMKQRFKSLFIDYLLISGYAVFLFGVFTGVCLIVYQRIPRYSPIAAQFIAFALMILPVFVYFVITESGKARASIGKRKAKIHIQYQRGEITSALLRNLIKLLPWQCAHMAVIEGVYQEYTSPFVIIFYILSVVLSMVYVLLAVFRKDHKSVPDLVAHTVVLADEMKQDADAAVS